MQMPIVKLADFIRHRKEFIRIDDFTKYTRPRVQLHWRGIVERDNLEGAAIKTKQQQVARKGELLVAEIDAKVGGIGIVPPELDGAVVSSHYFLFEIDEKKCLQKWLDYFVRSGAFDDQVAARGSTNYAAIRPQHVLSFEMPLPPLTEQHRIVARIEELSTKIEEARLSRHRALEETSALLSAEISRVFDQFPGTAKKGIKTFGIDGENPVQTGPFGAQLHASDFVENGIPVLNVGNVWPDGLRFARLDHVRPEKAAQLSRYSLKTDDLLFARSGATLGKVCLVPAQCEGWLMTGHLFRVRFDQTRIFPPFAFAALHGARLVHDQVFGQIRGATRPGYNTSLLGNVEIPLPPLPEQRRIVAYLDGLQAKVDTVHGLQEESEAELNALMPSFLSRAFAGEL
jgi:type I restriction enzyme S subunit